MITSPWRPKESMDRRQLRASSTKPHFAKAVKTAVIVRSFLDVGPFKAFKGSKGHRKRPFAPSERPLEGRAAAPRPVAASARATGAPSQRRPAWRRHPAPHRSSPRWGPRCAASSAPPSPGRWPSHRRPPVPCSPSCAQRDSAPAALARWSPPRRAGSTCLRHRSEGS